MHEIVIWWRDTASLARIVPATFNAAIYHIVFIGYVGTLIHVLSMR